MDKTKATRIEGRELHSRPSSSNRLLPDEGFRERTRQTREWKWLMSLERSKYADAQVALL